MLNLKKKNTESGVIRNTIVTVTNNPTYIFLSIES